MNDESTSTYQSIWFKHIQTRNVGSATAAEVWGPMPVFGLGRIISVTGEREFRPSAIEFDLLQYCSVALDWLSIQTPFLGILSYQALGSLPTWFANLL